MIVSINQPAYLPWLGYIHRISLSDIHVVLDHVQFEKNSFTNRNKIRTREGSTMLTIPVKTKGQFGNIAINKIETADENWNVKHSKSIQLIYSKAKYYKDYSEIINEFYTERKSKLMEQITPMNNWFLNELGIGTKILYSSEMQIEGTKSDLVLNICKALNASTYLSGPFGRDYLDINSFRNAGINVVFHDYIHPEYPQSYNGFEPYMSVLDLILNNGKESINYLNKGNEKTF